MKFKANKNHMKKITLVLSLLISGVNFAQTNPAITGWIQNTTNIMGRHYEAGNSTAIDDNVLANVQTVQYSANWVYVSTKGIPAYITGPFQDGNPSFASDQNAIYKFPLVPTPNSGSGTATTPGNIGVFINGVSLFDWRDGVAWNNATSALCGGPGNPPCPGGMGSAQPWNRDAIPAEMAGFDCAKAHPANGNYHHHQNPTAFNLDLNVVSNVCDLYPADGLYTITPTEHSPLLGFAYDGYPIYGAIGYANVNGTGGFTRMKSGYSQRNITVRTHYADGTDVVDGPAVSTTYPIGYFREDNEFIANPAEDYLDEHNGRFCVTPEYPNGTYAYFCTVDDNYNSVYPYVVGPTFYGNVVAAKVTTISETVTTYTPEVAGISEVELKENFKIYPNPVADILIVQATSLMNNDATLQLIDVNGKVVATNTLFQGSTLAHFDVATFYDGVYYLKITNQSTSIVEMVVIGAGK